MEIENIFKDLIIFLLITTIIIIVLRPTQKDIDAYNRCLKSYDKKTCQKMTFGN